MVTVNNAVDEFSIANMLESEPYEASENITKGITLLVIANIIECFQIGFKSSKYFFVNRIGKNIKEAKINLVCTKAIAPNSGVAILMKIKALPQIAPRKINNAQYLISIINKNPQKFGGLKTRNNYIIFLGRN